MWVERQPKDGRAVEKGRTWMLASKRQGQSEHEIPVRLVPVETRLTRLGRKLGMDC